MVGGTPVVIGRATDCQIVTQDGLVSRRHARVVYDGLYWIEDLGSSNGVYVGSERVQRRELKAGDTFRCGALQVRFEAEAPRRTGMGQAPVLGSALPPAPMPSPPVIAPPAAVPQLPPVPLPAVLPSAAPVSSLLSEPTAPIRVAAGANDLAAVRAELAAARAELDGERRKRTDLDFELSELRRKLEELQAKPAAPAGAGAEEAERLRRRVEQLESELRRKGGGVVSGSSANTEALRSTETERDRLRARVTELEAQAAAQAAKPAAPAKTTDDQEMETIRLRRRVEQLESELRRLRGGKPAEPSPSDAAGVDPIELAELKDQVRKLIGERDEAQRRASAAASAGSDAKLVEELERTRRRVEQLESELKRRPMGAVSEQQRLEAQRQELESALRQLREVERERDGLRELVARGGVVTNKTGTMPAAKLPTAVPPAVTEQLTSVSDGLADIRAALRAAGDDGALAQLEQLRAALRQACLLLGITL